MKKRWRWLGFGLLAAVVLGMLGFALWANAAAQPEAQALNSLQSNQDVKFEEINRWLVFTPADINAETALILYPGGRVDYRAYASHASAIAARGFTVIVVPMPLNFAFFGVNRAADVIQAFPEISRWAVGGHSLGGAMAAEFTKANLSLVDGVVLWASYPAENTNFSNSNLAALSIYASNDGLATREEIDSSRDRLPSDTNFVKIEGGNHAGFGWYGAQNGDGQLEISKTAQQEQIVEATVKFLETLGN